MGALGSQSDAEEDRAAGDALAAHDGLEDFA